MSGFSYGASHLMGGDYFGQEDDVLQRSVDEDLDELVQRNIQDVLRQVGVDDYDGPHDLTARAGRAHHEDDPRPEIPAMRTGAAAYGRSDGPGLLSTSYDDAVPASTAASTPTALQPQQRADSRRPSAGIAQQQSQQQQSRASGLPGRPKRPSGDTVPDGGPTGGTAPRAAGAGAGTAARASSSTEASHAAGAASSSLQGISMNLDVPGQPEASLRLHKARIKGLEEELGRANKALLDREKQLTEALRELKDLRSQAASWARDKKALEGQLDRAKKQAADAEVLARTTESQVRELAKADSRAERERRASEAEVRARDARLQRALEEVERYKQLLNEVRAQEREARGTAQHDTSRLLAENRKLERQRGELITAFKKQLKLIEVLKRQKVHLEAARALQFSEEEFLKTLEMGAS